YERRAAESYALDLPRRAPIESLDGLEAEELEMHVRRLPADVRFAVILHFYEGRPHDEVAEVLGCPKGTAASRIRRGVERLRESLNVTARGMISIEVIEGALRAVPPAPPFFPPPPAALALAREATNL